MSIDAPQQRPIDDVGPYSIRTPASNSTFRLTIPADVRKAANLEQGDCLAVRPCIGSDGRVDLQYIPEAYAPDELVTITVSGSSSATARIPSAIGRALRFDDTYEARWGLIHTDPPVDVAPERVPLRFRPNVDGPDDADEEVTTVPIIEAQTTQCVEEVVPESAMPMSREPITRQAQDNIQHEGREWSQEQFRYYLSGDEMADLGWASGEEVAVTIRRRGDRPAIVFTPTRIADENEVRLTKTVNETGSRQVDGLIYISRDIVRSLQFIDTPLMWISDEGRLVAAKTGRNR